jgi:hypothetical protein
MIGFWDDHVVTVTLSTHIDCHQIQDRSLLTRGSKIVCPCRLSTKSTEQEIKVRGIQTGAPSKSFAEQKMSIGRSLLSCPGSVITLVHISARLMFHSQKYIKEVLILL